MLSSSIFLQYTLIDFSENLSGNISDTWTEKELPWTTLGNTVCNYVLQSIVKSLITETLRRQNVQEAHQLVGPSETLCH